MFLIICGIVTFFVWLYILFIREWLDAHWAGIHRWHLFEDWLWDKSRTILAARLYWVGGIIVAIHEMAAQAGMDWTPLVQELGKLVPVEYRGLVLSACIILTGIGFEWLRHQTTMSIAEKKQE